MTLSVRIWIIATISIALALSACRPKVGSGPMVTGSNPATMTDGESPARRAARRLPLAVCRADWGDEEILCGSYEVYENRALGSGRKIPLKIVVIPALAARPEPDPIFDMDGGPGMPSTAAAPWYATDAPFRRTRDIVLVDLRGMGGSNPLHCNLVGNRRVLQNHLQEMYSPHRVEACRKELEQKADLTQYTTSTAMEDIEEVRAWLGYERINILALSYGGRAAYVYARAYPERVRAMILQAPADLDLKMPLYHASWAERAFVQVCADCRSDPACNAAFPELEAKLRKLVDQLRTRPATVTYSHPQLDGSATVTIRADIFVESLRSALYDGRSRRRIPWIVHHAYEGDFGPFLDRAIPRELESPPVLAEGAYLSITGTEDAPFIGREEVTALTEGTLLGDYRVVQQRRAANLWPRGRLPAGFFDKVVLDGPALIVQGGRDPVVGGGRVIHNFRNAREVIVPYATHIIDGLSNMECVYRLMNSFVETADPHGLDIACVNEMLPEPFKVAPETASSSS